MSSLRLHLERTYQSRLQSRVCPECADAAKPCGRVRYGPYRRLGHRGLPGRYTRNPEKTTAAFDDQLFSGTAERVYSTAIVAHIRRATVGQTSIFNTHPFVSGSLDVCHNGTVSGFDQIHQQLERETAPDLQSQRRGETDSEQYFLWLLSQIPSRGQNEFRKADCETIVASLRESVGRLANLCRAAAPSESPSLTSY